MTRRLLPVFIILLFGMSFYVAVLVYASLSAVRPETELRTWQSSGKLLDEGSWKEIHSRLQAALKLDPSNPGYLETEARLFRYKAMMPGTLPSKALATYRVALTQYRHLLTLRPSWAPYWAAIVAIKYELWEYDEEMQTAFRNAASLGPWFYGNQKILLQAGMHGWYFFDQDGRNIIKQILQGALQLQPKAVIRQAMQEGFLDRLEPYFEANADLNEIYEKEIKRLQREQRKRKRKRK